MTRYQPRYSLISMKGPLNETSVIKSSVQLENPSVILPREKNPSNTRTYGAWRQSLQYEILIQAVRDRDALNTCRNTSLLPPLISCSWIIHFYLHPSISLSFLPSLCVSSLLFFARKAQRARGRVWSEYSLLLFTSTPSFHGPSAAFECVWWNQTKSPVHAAASDGTRNRFLSAHSHASTQTRLHHWWCRSVSDDMRHISISCLSGFTHTGDNNN